MATRLRHHMNNAGYPLGLLTVAGVRRHDVNLTTGNARMHGKCGITEPAKFSLVLRMASPELVRWASEDQTWTQWRLWYTPNSHALASEYYLSAHRKNHSALQPTATSARSASAAEPAAFSGLANWQTRSSALPHQPDAGESWSITPGIERRATSAMPEIAGLQLHQFRIYGCGPAPGGRHSIWTGKLKVSGRNWITAARKKSLSCAFLGVCRWKRRRPRLKLALQP